MTAPDPASCADERDQYEGLEGLAKAALVLQPKSSGRLDMKWWNANEAYQNASQPQTILKLIAENRALRGESEALTKALTGLTCGGSEFFNRVGGRYVADIAACVGWVRRNKTEAHRRTVDAMLENKRLRDTLERIATVDQGGAFLSADGCRKSARAALSPIQQGAGE